MPVNTNGQWENNKKKGVGKYIYANKDVYEGEWLNDKAHGYGKYTHFDCATYVGYWKEDMQSGKGREAWPDGAKFEGNYINGKKEGEGEFLARLSMPMLNRSILQSCFSNKSETELTFTVNPDSRSLSI